jgi:hypothetical protein
MKKNDWIIIGIVLLIAGSVYIWNMISEKNQSDERYADIYYNGELYERVNVNEQKTVTIETDIGKNVIQIDHGKVTMIEADCPDKVCLNTGTIEKVNRSIVCLPNKVHVQITGDLEEEIDVIVQ